MPAAVVSSDYDFIPISDNILGLAIADGSGHSLPAALVMRDIYMDCMPPTALQDHPDDGEVESSSMRQLTTSSFSFLQRDWKQAASSSTATPATTPSCCAPE
jgi:hypothetical protein